MSEPPDLRIAGGTKSRIPDSADRDPAEMAVDDEDGKDFVERMILPYIEESTLWPVLIVIVLHVVAFIAPVMVSVVRNRSFIAGFALLWLVFLTVQAGRHEASRGRRLGALNIILALTWVLSVIAATLGHRADIL